MLILTRRAGESFFIGEDVLVTIADVSGDKVKVSITAPREIPILRKELRDAEETNREALAPEKSAVLALAKKL